MASIFVVYGSCDDVEGYYTEHAMAIEAAKRTGGEYSKHTLNELPVLPDGLYGWFVDLSADGEVTRVTHCDAEQAKWYGDEAWQHEGGNVSARVRAVYRVQAEQKAIRMFTRGEFKKYEPTVFSGIVSNITRSMLLNDDMDGFVFWKKPAEAGGQ